MQMAGLGRYLQGREKNPEKFNRQINFFIMRHMWKVVRGRGNGTIYDVLYTSRERYTRVIDSGTIRFKAGELDKWHELTGISKDIFTGKTVFRCVYKDGDNEKKITRSEWNDLFNWRDNSTGAEKREKDSIQYKICKKLNNSIMDDMSNRDFYALCHYFKRMKPLPFQTPDEVIKRILDYLDILSFEYLNTCSYQKLDKMYKSIREKYNLASKVYQYRTLCNEEAQKK